MAISRKRKLIVGAAALIVLAGCVREKRQPSAPAAVPVPAKNVGFRLLPPDKEKRGGLYAVSVDALVSAKSTQRTFAQAADGKLSKPVAGQGVILVGKLPGLVREEHFFKAGAGTIKGGEIEIPVKYVRYAGPMKALIVSRAAYFTVNLPALPAGKYRATVKFQDWQYIGDKSSITFPPQRKSHPPRFKPLVCEFEVKAAAPGATLSARKTKFVSGKPMEFSVSLKNTGKHAMVLGGDLQAPDWSFIFTPRGGGIPRWAFFRGGRDGVPMAAPVPPMKLAAGKEVVLECRVGGPGWRFKDARPMLYPQRRIRTKPPLSALPPGKYTVTASYSHRAGHAQFETCTHWHGVIGAGSPEIEVTKPAAGKPLTEKQAREQAFKLAKAELAKGKVKGLDGRPILRLGFKPNSWPVVKKKGGRWVFSCDPPAGLTVSVVFSLDGSDPHVGINFSPE